MKLDTKDIAIDLNFTLIRVFLSIVDTKSVKDTADRLGVTQPSISQHLEKLRTIYNDRLFIRRAGEMVPTLRAQRLEASLRAILRIADDTLCDTIQINTEAPPRLRLSIEGYLAHTIGPRLIDHFTSNGQATLQIDALCPAHQQSTVSSETEALILHNPLPASLPGFALLAEFDDPWVIARNRHDTELMKRVDLCEAPQLVAPSGINLPAQLRQLVVAQCPLEALPLTIAATGMAGLLPKSLARAARVYFDFTIDDAPVSLEPTLISLYVPQATSPRHTSPGKGLAELLLATLRHLIAGETT